MAGLTAKQRRFAQEYIVDLNGSRAAERAGYSPKTAYSIANQLLNKLEVQLEVQAMMKARERRVDISADRVLTELARIAFADTTDAVRIENGSVVVRDTSELSNDTRLAISEIKETKTAMGGGSLGVKFHDKKGALELLGRHLGLFKENLSGEEMLMPTRLIVEVVDGRKPALPAE